MTYLEMLVYNQALNDTSKRSLMELALPPAVTDALARNAQMLADNLKIFADQQNRLVDKYAAKGKDGKPVIEDNNVIRFATKDNEKAYAEEREKLLQVQVNVMPATFPQGALDYTDPRYDVLTAADRLKLNWMIKEDEK